MYNYSELLILERYIRRIRVDLLLTLMKYVDVLTVLVIVFLYSASELWPVIVLFLGTLVYLHSYRRVVEQDWLKKNILKDKSPTARSYIVFVYANRLLFFLIFIFVEMTLLPGLLGYKPPSLSIIYFLVAQLFLVISWFDLSEFNVAFRTMSKVKHFTLMTIILTGSMLSYIGVFVLGILSSFSPIIYSITSTVFINLVLAELLWGYRLLMKRVSKFVKPTNVVGNQK